MIDSFATASIEPAETLEKLDILPLTEEQVLDDELSDQREILKAVSGAQMNTLQGAPIKWYNDVTGSTGMISSLAQKSEAQGRNCRSFDVFRTSFDGVVLYNASACNRGDNVWLMESFAPVEAEG